jgi:predicted heme/steroid binding protein
MDDPAAQEALCHCEIGGCPCEHHGGKRAARSDASGKQWHRVEHGDQLECGCSPELRTGADGAAVACSCSRGYCPCQDPSEHAAHAAPPPGIVDFSRLGHSARLSNGRGAKDAAADHAAPEHAPPGPGVRAVGESFHPDGYESPSPDPDTSAHSGCGAPVLKSSSLSWRKARSLDEALSQATPEEAAAIVASNTDSMPRLRTTAEDAEEKRQRHMAAERLRARVSAAAEAALTQRSWAEEVQSLPAGPVVVPDTAPRPVEDVAAAAREAMRRQQEYLEWQRGATAAMSAAASPAASPRGPHGGAGHPPGSPLSSLPVSPAAAAASIRSQVQAQPPAGAAPETAADQPDRPAAHAQGVAAPALEMLPGEPGGTGIPSPRHAPVVAGYYSPAAVGLDPSVPAMSLSLPAPMLALNPSTSLLSLSDSGAPTRAPRRVRAGSPRAAPPPLRYFTPEEVSKHNSRDDCWLISHGNVYDVTPFLESHPAGPASILRHAGTDASRDFDFHSRGAQKLWAKFQVGFVHGHGPGCVIS